MTTGKMRDCVPFNLVCLAFSQFGLEEEFIDGLLRYNSKVFEDVDNAWKNASDAQRAKAMETGFFPPLFDLAEQVYEDYFGDD